MCSKSTSVQLNCALCTLCAAAFQVHFSKVHTAHCTVNSEQCTVHGAQWTVLCAHCVQLPAFQMHLATVLSADNAPTDPKPLFKARFHLFKYILTESLGEEEELHILVLVSWVYLGKDHLLITPTFIFFKISWDNLHFAMSNWNSFILFSSFQGGITNLYLL